LLSYYLLNRSGDAVKNYADYYDTTVARNIANTAVDLTLRQLRDNSSWRDGFEGVCFNDGILSATLTDTSIGGSNYINIAATGEYNDHSKTIVVLVEAVGFVPNGVRGSITANSDVRTLGTLQIDGREHTIDLTLIPNSGTFGISTTGTYSHGGELRCGGYCS